MVTHVPAEAHGDERGALLAFVEAQRGGLRRAVLGLNDEQAARGPAPASCPCPDCSSTSPSAS